LTDSWVSLFVASMADDININIDIDAGAGSHNAGFSGTKA